MESTPRSRAPVWQQAIWVYVVPRLKTSLTCLKGSLLNIWRSNILPQGLLSARRYRRIANVVLRLISSRVTLGALVGVALVLLSGVARPAWW